MDKKTIQILLIASKFRNAIEGAKFDGELENSINFKNFPHGCCDDTCDLLSYYLLTFGYHTLQVIGTYRDDIPENTTNHAWLCIDENIIIDITGDQFEECAGFKESVYVGPINDFYLNLDSIRILNNYNIQESQRLMDLYNIIVKYM